MSSLWSNPLFGILLSVMAFYIGGVAARKARTPIANPLLIAMVICVLVLKILHISCIYPMMTTWKAPSLSPCSWCP